jgi:hypothetical protein
MIVVMCPALPLQRRSAVTGFCGGSPNSRRQLLIRILALASRKMRFFPEFIGSGAKKVKIKADFAVGAPLH